MTPTSIKGEFFVPYQPPGSSKRDLELLDSLRRSYIARRWHQSRGKGSQRTAQRRKPQGDQHRVKGRGSSTRSIEEEDNFPATGFVFRSRSNSQPQCQVDIISYPDCGLVADTRCTTLKIDASTASALSYFQLVWTSRAFHSATTHGTGERTNAEAGRALLSDAMRDSLLFHSLVAAVMMRMATVHKTRLQAEYHAAVAMARLRDRIVDDVGEQSSLVMPMLFLAAYQVYCADLDGSRTHLQALQRMNATDQLSGYAKSLCHRIDLFSASSSLQSPVFAHSLKSCLLQDRRSPSSRGFGAYDCILGRQLLTIINSIARCSDVAQRSKLRDPQPDDVCVTAREIAAWSEDLTYHLLEEMSGSISKQSCVIALLMWLSYLPNIILRNDLAEAVPSSEFLKVMPARGAALAFRLKQCILSTKLDLWILATGIVCSIEKADVKYCALEFARLGRSLTITNVKEQLFGSFLSLDGFDRVDSNLLTEVLDPQTSASAIERIVD